MVKPVTNVKYLDEIITARGTNKRDLARTMGMSYDGFCRKMKGKARFTLQDSLNIAMALNLNPYQFSKVFFGVEDLRTYDLQRCWLANTRQCVCITMIDAAKRSK